MLVTYRLPNGEEDRAGILTPDGVIVPGFLRGLTGLDHVLADWAAIEPQLREWTVGDGAAVADAILRAPISRPGKLLGAGANYRDHAREMGIDPVPDDVDPFFFLVPSTSIVGPCEPIRIPSDPAARVDWEAELAVVLGVGGRGIPVGDALAHVAGYTVINDVTARGYSRRQDPIAPPFEVDWLTSKGMDTFCPMGPGLVPAWVVGPTDDLQLRLWRNGRLEQDGSTSQLLSGVAELIAAASRCMTLEAGDVIATGTPPGVGAARGLQLADGDEVLIEIAGVGRLRSPVVLDDPDR